MPEKPPRRWFAFSLRTLVVLVTALCVWLGYHVNWRRERREARKWLDAHAVYLPHGAFVPIKTPPRSMSWSLSILGEKPIDDAITVYAIDHIIVVGMRRPDWQNVSEYHKRVAEIRKIFLECDFKDIHADYPEDSVPIMARLKSAGAG